MPDSAFLCCAKVCPRYSIESKNKKRHFFWAEGMTTIQIHQFPYITRSRFLLERRNQITREAYGLTREMLSDSREVYVSRVKNWTNISRGIKPDLYQHLSSEQTRQSLRLSRDPARQYVSRVDFRTNISRGIKPDNLYISRGIQPDNTSLE